MDIDLNKKNSWLANVSWTLSSNIVYSLSQWGILICIVKLCNAETVGSYALIVATVSPLFLLFSMQLRGVLATDAKQQFDIGHYLTLRIGTTLMVLFIVLLISLFGIFSTNTLVLLFIITISKGIESISDLIFGMFQLRERMDMIGKSILTKGVSSLIITATALYFTRSIVIALCLVFLMWLFILITYDLNNVIRLVRVKLRFDLKIIKSIALTAIPLGVVMGLVSFNENIPRYVIQHNMGEILLGYFASIAYFKVAGSTVVNALGQSSISRMARYCVQLDYHKFIKSMLNMLYIIIPLSIVGLIVVGLYGDAILTLVYTDDYQGFQKLFMYMMIAGVLEYISSVFGYSMTAANYYKVQPYLYLLTVAVNLLLCIFLIPKFGLEGAAISFIVANTIKLLGSIAIITFIVKRMQASGVREGVRL